MEEVVNKDRCDLANEILHPDYVLHFSKTSLTWSIQQQLFRTVKLGFSDWHEEILDMIVDGDKFAIRLKGSGTHDGEYLGIPATGRKMQWFMPVFGRFLDGRLREQWATSDVLNILSQIGVDLMQHVPNRPPGTPEKNGDVVWRGAGYGR